MQAYLQYEAEVCKSEINVKERKKKNKKRIELSPATASGFLNCILV